MICPHEWPHRPSKLTARRGARPDVTQRDRATEVPLPALVPTLGSSLMTFHSVASKRTCFLGVGRRPALTNAFYRMWAILWQVVNAEAQNGHSCNRQRGFASALQPPEAWASQRSAATVGRARPMPNVRRRSCCSEPASLGRI
jgi:hypothetical protein